MAGIRGRQHPDLTYPSPILSRRLLACWPGSLRHVDGCPKPQFSVVEREGEEGWCNEGLVGTEMREGSSQACAVGRSVFPDFSTIPPRTSMTAYCRGVPSTSFRNITKASSTQLPPLLFWSNVSVSLFLFPRTSVLSETCGVDGIDSAGGSEPLHLRCWMRSLVRCHCPQRSVRSGSRRDHELCRPASLVRLDRLPTPILLLCR